MDEIIRQVLENELGLKIGRRIGCGGFSEVYEAQSAEGVSCAVKVSLAQVDERNRGIAKELENLNLVNAVNGHPHVVQFMGAWLVGGYLVTRWELSREGSLHDLVLRYQADGKKGIPFEKLIKHIYDAAEGIDFLNGLGIYHRDIKPQNLLLFHGRVKIADLGLAKFAGASTVSHTGLGTLGYLPPEAYDQHRLAKTVDLYSLAATYVKLRTGWEPFGENPHEIVLRQLRGAPVLDGLRPGEAELVRQALAPRPEDRPQQGACAWVKQLYRASSGRPAAPASQARQAHAPSVTQRAPDLPSASAPLLNTPRVEPRHTGTETLPQPSTRGGVKSDKADEEATDDLMMPIGIALIGGLTLGAKHGGGIIGGIVGGIAGGIVGLTFVVISEETSEEIGGAMGKAIGRAIRWAVSGAIFGASRPIHGSSIVGAIVGAIAGAIVGEIRWAFAKRKKVG